MSDPDLPNLVRKLASAARSASAALGRADGVVRNTVLRRVAWALEGPSRAAVLEANERDLAVAQDLNLSAAKASRLRLDSERLSALASELAHGSRHTEVIVTDSWVTAQRFAREVDAGAVLVNASPHFDEAARLGYGRAFGTSTTKLHAYGPLGPEELCAKKWVVFGEGQGRG